MFHYHRDPDDERAAAVGTPLVVARGDMPSQGGRDTRAACHPSGSDGEGEPPPLEERQRARAADHGSVHLGA